LEEQMIAKAYVDGSYNHALGIYGAGVVLFIGEDEKPITFAKTGNNPDFVKSRNVAGEVLAATLVLAACKEVPELTELTLYYDYAGIECWVNGLWKANTKLSKGYREFAKTMPFKLLFRKVKSHSGNTFNELADSLAKKACSL
jgi:ribonuclease HI